MPKPWEKYASAQPDQSGPWAKYAAPEASPKKEEAGIPEGVTFLGSEKLGKVMAGVFPRSAKGEISRMRGEKDAPSYLQQVGQGTADYYSSAGRAVATGVGEVGEKLGLTEDRTIGQRMSETEGKNLASKIIRDPGTGAALVAAPFAAAAGGLVKGASLLPKLGKFATIGAIEGAGSAAAHQAERAGEGGGVSGKEIAGEVAIGTALGPLAPVAGKLIKGGVNLAKYGAGKTLAGAAKGVDVATGSKVASDVLEGSKEGIGSFLEKTKQRAKDIYSPQRADDFDQLKRDWEEIGGDPDDITKSMEFGELSEPARQQRAAASNPGGQAELERYTRAQSVVQGAMDETVQKIGGGEILSRPEAGEMVLEGFGSGVKRLLGGIEGTHSNVMKEMKGLEIAPQAQSLIESKLKGIEKFAIGRAERGIDATQKSSAKSLLQAVEAVRASKATYKQMNEIREMIGEVAFDKVGTFEKIGAHEKHLRDLYFTINDALIKSVEAGDVMRSATFKKPMAPGLIEGNKLAKEILDDKSILSPLLGGKGKDPEKLFTSALGGTKKVEALKRFLEPEDLQKVKAAYIESLIKRDTAGGFTFKGIANAMRSKKDVINALFEPEEIAEMGKIVRLGDRIGSPVTPGSAGDRLFGAELSRKPIQAAFEKVLEPIGEIQSSIGVQRARRLAQPSTPRRPIPGAATMRRSLGRGVTRDVFGLDQEEPQRTR